MIVLATPSQYFDFFADYFTSASIAIALGLVAVTIAGLLFVFRKSQNSVQRSRLLISTMTLSSAFWTFVISSLAFCIVMVGRYWVSPLETIAFVSKMGLLISLVAGLAVYFGLRGHAVRQAASSLLNSVSSILDPLKEGEGTLRQIAKSAGFDSSLRLALLRPDSVFPVSSAFDYGQTRVVALREDLFGILDNDELEAILAHEVAHIRHRDSFKKTLVTTFRMGFQFDLLVRFIEAAFYREREYAADEFSGMYTGKPAALASALLKIYELLNPRANAGSASLSSLSTSHSPGLLSKQPPLEERIKRLLTLSKTLREKKVRDYGKIESYYDKSKIDLNN